jgi:hypothetical protein
MGARASRPPPPAGPAAPDGDPGNPPRDEQRDTAAFLTFRALRSALEGAAETGGLSPAELDRVLGEFAAREREREQRAEESQDDDASDEIYDRATQWATHADFATVEFLAGKIPVALDFAQWTVARVFFFPLESEAIDGRPWSPWAAYVRLLQPNMTVDDVQRFFRDPEGASGEPALLAEVALCFPNGYDATTGVPTAERSPSGIGEIVRLKTRG